MAALPLEWILYILYFIVLYCLLDIHFRIRDRHEIILHGLRMLVELPPDFVVAFLNLFLGLRVQVPMD